MDNSINKRLVLLREAVAGRRGQRTFARMVGIKQQSISNYERGSIPSAAVLAKIVLATHVSAEWLLTGRGLMFPAGSMTASDSEPMLELIDENGQPVGASELAVLLDVTEQRARQFMEELNSNPVGRGRLPLVLRRSDGKVIVLQPRPRPGSVIKSKIRVEVTENDVLISVPAETLRRRAIRIVPELQ